ncbi:MAG: DNA mismatch repair endonuclease MutL [Ignavibacteria bacterium]|jgi:DNA mismatch repair protein MutL
MLKKIKILPENVTNKIAAGEVVQRPESVVKELMENALDAGAENMEVIIKRAGKALIQVVDDGSGMSEEDAVLCIQKHATSKIDKFDDLNSLATYGFRGEALSSIASVSQVEIKTERNEDEIGTLIKIEEENNIIKERGAFPKGTSIAVKNLFYNTPARRNFLKTNATELKHIIETFKKISLSNPEIAFKFYNDDDLVFNFEKGNLESRVKEVFADNITDLLIKVDEPTDYIGLKGYVSKPVYLRKSKGEQYLFINKRYVVSRTINHAVFSAYENILEKGDYPFFVLFLNIDSSKVDINVHPQKLEVKFDDENNIYNFVNAVVKRSMGSYDLVPSVSFDEQNDENERLNYNRSITKSENDFSDRPVFTKRRTDKTGVYSDNEIDLLFRSINTEAKQGAPTGEPADPFDNKTAVRQTDSSQKIYESKRDDQVSPTFIVSLHNKYILAQIKSGLMIIDQHVAHERILYEKILKSFDANLPFSQQLLFSQTLQVDPGDYELTKELEPFLTKMGFELKFFSKNTIVIDGVPSDIKVGTEQEILLDIIDEYKRNQREKQLEQRDNLAKSFSCKAAIKSGDKLSEQEMRLLVDQLFATSMPYVCPHGRPVIIKIPLEEFDKRFGRT